MEQAKDDVETSIKAPPNNIATPSLLPTSATIPAILPPSYKGLVQEMIWNNRTIIAASSAAVCGVVAGFPFDSIKTRMQTHHYNSIMDCVRKTYADEGMSGFFRGMFPPLVTVSVIKSVSFTVYENSKAYLKNPHNSILYFDGVSLTSLSTLSSIAGGVSGAVIAVLSCPLELVKIQKQLEVLTMSSLAGGLVSHRHGERRTSPLPKPLNPHEIKVTSNWHSAKEIVHLNGVLGLYRGFSLHFVRDVLGTGSYFGAYETVKRVLSTPSSPPGPMTHFFAGGICGMFCWMVVFPIDLVKSVWQKEAINPSPSFNSVVECARNIYKRNGLGGFYSGLSVTLVRAFPIHSINFLVYEEVKRIVQEWALDKE